MHALVVDDKDENLYYLQTLLEGAVFTVDVAHHGAEALVRARQKQPDIIISDLLMPVMDGYTLLRHWKADTKLKLIPFVVYTATYTEEEDERLAISMGADAFILKPTDPETFIDRIRKAVASPSRSAEQPSAPPIGEEKELLKIYSQTLIRKLEEKMLLLEKNNQELERDIAQRRKVEAERQALLDELSERIKELGALHRAANLLSNDRIPIPDLLERLASILPSAMKYPETAGARVVYGNHQRETADGQNSKWHLQSRFTTSDGTHGEVEVYYFEEMPEADEGPFLDEERQLLDSLSDMLRQHFERRIAQDIVLRVAHSVTIPIGDQFIDELTRLMVETLSATGGAIGLINPDNRAEICTHSFIFKGERVPKVCYDVTETPCAQLVKGQSQFIERRIQEKFPNDRMLVDFELESYAGTPLLDPKGEVIGIVAVFSSQPMHRSEVMMSALQIFAARAAVEIERQHVTAALANSQRQLELILHSVGEGIHGIDIQGCITFENPASTAILGYSEAELIGKHSHSLIHHHRADGTDFPIEECPIHQTLRDGVIRRISHDAFFRKDGSMVPVDYTVSPVRDENGNIASAVVSFRDITEQKAAAAKITESEARFRLLSRATNDAIWDWDLVSQRLWWNEGIETLFGYKPEEIELTIDSWYSRIHPDERDAVVADTHQAIENGATGWSGEYRFKRKDGTYAYVLDRGHIIRNADGVAVRMIGGMTDLSERMLVENKLREQAALLDKAQDAIMVRDLEHRITYWNKSAERLFGWTASEVLGKPIEQILNSNSMDFAKATEITLQEGEWLGEIEQLTKTGAKRIIEGRWTLVRDNAGNPTSILAINTDITHSHQLAEQLRQSQKLEAIGQLAGGVAHDFNNILAVMIMQVDLTEQADHLSEETKDGLRQIRSAAERAANLTRQLLLFSRRQVMQPRNTDLNDAVTTIAKMLQRIIGEDIHLQLNLHSTPLMIHADSGMMDQVLMNLAINARDAMPNGGHLRISTFEKVVAESTVPENADALPGRYACLSVHDSGEGIPVEIIPRIFDPFFTTKEPGKGTGLGLATVFGIVKQHKGWIECESDPGKGTCFKLYIPLSTSTIHEPSATKPQTRSRGRNEIILLVEDDPSVRKLTRMTLERNGYSVLEAANGKEALVIWQEHRDNIALLLTDLVMPAGISGQQLARQLQVDRPNLHVIFTSGYSEEIAGRELELRHGENFMQKPCTPDQILEAVRRGLDDARPPEA